MIVRRATVADIDQLVDLRVAFLREAGHDINEGPLRTAVAAYLERALPTEDVLFWLVADGKRIVGTAAMTVYERMSWDGVSKEGYVLNMYTVPSYRRRGIASKILDALLEHARSEDLRLALVALEDARELYERAGFAPDARYLRWRP